MKRKIVTSIIIICMFTFIINIIPNYSSAASKSDITSNFDGSVDTSVSGINTGKLAMQNIVGTILDIVRMIGASIAVVILMIIGGKYMIASAGDRADIKKYAINYIIGALILLSASSLLGMVKDVVDRSIK